jgi:hypothetical protein
MQSGMAIRVRLLFFLDVIMTSFGEVDDHMEVVFKDYGATVNFRLLWENIIFTTDPHAIKVREKIPPSSVTFWLTFPVHFRQFLLAISIITSKARDFTIRWNLSLALAYLTPMVRLFLYG